MEVIVFQFNQKYFIQRENQDNAGDLTTREAEFLQTPGAIITCLHFQICCYYVGCWAGC